jgi:hypothetical protein
VLEGAAGSSLSSVPPSTPPPPLTMFDLLAARPEGPRDPGKGESMSSIWKSTLCLLGLSMSLGLVGGACAASPVDPATEEATEESEDVNENATPAEPPAKADLDIRGRARCVRRCEDRFRVCVRSGAHGQRCHRERQRCMDSCRF